MICLAALLAVAALASQCSVMADDRRARFATCVDQLDPDAVTLAGDIVECAEVPR